MRPTRRTGRAKAILISLAGAALGLCGSVVLLNKLSGWQPFPATPVHVPVSPVARVYVVALALALVSAFLFGMIPVRQVLRNDPYQIVKAGTTAGFGRRMTARDLLLGLQIAICAVLVTSSMVALRGLVRSLSADFGFEPRNTMLAGGNLAMAGYTGDQIPVTQRRMIEAVQTIPGVEYAGLVNNYPPLGFAAASRVNVFSDHATDLRAATADAMPYWYKVSPGYFQAAHTALIAGRDFGWHDDKNAPRVAVVNRQFAIRMFGSAANALYRRFKWQDGTRVLIVGVVEDGKYLSVTEDPQATIFRSYNRRKARPM